jgi:hypothetical protein
MAWTTTRQLVDPSSEDTVNGAWVVPRASATVSLGGDGADSGEDCVTVAAPAASYRWTKNCPGRDRREPGGRPPVPPLPGLPDPVPVCSPARALNVEIVIAPLRSWVSTLPSR